MFSATFPEQVQVLAQEHLKDDYLFVAVGILGGANTDITQEFLLTSGMPDKKEKLVLICQEEISKSGIFALKFENFGNSRKEKLCREGRSKERLIKPVKAISQLSKTSSFHELKREAPCF